MDIYMKRQEFLLKFNPKTPKKGLLPLTHPELFITDKIRVSRYPENFQQCLIDYVSFKCELLLIDRLHDGLWLFTNHDKECTSFLGGYVSPEDWKYSNTNPYYVLFSTLIREMIESHPVCKHSMGIDPMLQMSVAPTIAEFRETIEYLLRRYKFDSVSDQIYLFYQYWVEQPGREKLCLDSVRIYVMIEVDKPVGRIPTLSNYTHDEFTWYSRRDHVLNLSTNPDRASLFQSVYQNDFRVTDSGLDILDNIFQTESIFGKLDIY